MALCCWPYRRYPATSPYVTSVGATEYGSPVANLRNPPPACHNKTWTCISGGAQEQAVSYAQSRYLSGGGFSSVDARPAYQAVAVDAYLNSGVPLPDQAAWNRTGRGFPDVAAIGMNGFIVDGGREGLVSGTSMSTPIFAAIVALAQADYQRITNNTLGFLNPLRQRLSPTTSIRSSDASPPQSSPWAVCSFPCLSCPCDLFAVRSVQSTGLRGRPVQRCRRFHHTAAAYHHLDPPLSRADRLRCWHPFPSLSLVDCGRR